MKILFVLTLLFVVACTPIDCESYAYDACPSSCSLCGEGVWDSALDCHSNDYCELASSCGSIFNLSECKAPCDICPPCETCSVLVCQPAAVCDELGFTQDFASFFE